jgi:hypothetical protein
LLEEEVSVMRRRSLLLRWAACALVLGLTGCWLAVGVEDRKITRCAYPFVEVASADCSECLDENCCDEAKACEDSQACLACTRPLLPGEGTECTFPAELTALRSCVRGNCMTSCYPKPFSDLQPPYKNTLQSKSGGACIHEGDWFDHVDCNPITNEPCEPGEACSFDSAKLVFACHGSGQALGVGARCGLVEGLCAPGHDCANGRCYRYCCPDKANTDCEPHGKCHSFDYPGLTIGVCVEAD